MTETDAIFSGSVPALYEQYLVPLLFEPYSVDLSKRLGDLQQGLVLEVAAGTGVVTRALRASLPAAVRIVATDLNEGMLGVAQARGAGADVSWRQADAQSLPFEDGVAAAVVCQFGVMFMPDKLAAYREARRVLGSGGRYLFNVWEGLEHNETSRVVDRAVAASFPEDPPRFYARTPFGYHDAESIREQLRASGFGRVEIESVEKVSRAPSAEHAALGLCQGTPLRGEIEARGPTRLREVTDAAATALRARFGTGAFDNRMRALVVTAHC